MIRKTILVGFVSLLLGASMVQGFETINCGEVELIENKEVDSSEITPTVPLLFGTGVISAHFDFVNSVTLIGVGEHNVFLSAHGDAGGDYLEFNGERYSFPAGLDIIVFGFKGVVTPLDEGRPGNIEGFAPFFIAW